MTSQNILKLILKRHTFVPFSHLGQSDPFWGQLWYSWRGDPRLARSWRSRLVVNGKVERWIDVRQSFIAISMQYATCCLLPIGFNQVEVRSKVAVKDTTLTSPSPKKLLLEKQKKKANITILCMLGAKMYWGLSMRWFSQGIWIFQTKSSFN